MLVDVIRLELDAAVTRVLTVLIANVIYLQCTHMQPLPVDQLTEIIPSEIFQVDCEPVCFIIIIIISGFGI